MRWLFLVLIASCGPKAESAPASDPSSEPKNTDPAAIERHNQAIPYRNRAIEAGNQGDWAAARTALKECVDALNDPDCVKELQDLESRHRF